MELKTKRYTAAEFDELVLLPENVGRNFELIGGEIIEKMVSNSYCSIIVMRIGRILGNFVDEHNLGWITGEAGGYRIGEQRYMPDLGFLSKKRHPQVPKVTYIAMPPDLVIEVVSPTDQPVPLHVKVSNYLAENVVVWVIEPEKKLVYIHTPGQLVQSLNIEDTIDGGTVLPGFKLPVKDIFPIEPEES